MDNIKVAVAGDGGQVGGVLHKMLGSGGCEFAGDNDVDVLVAHGRGKRAGRAHKSRIVVANSDTHGALGNVAEAEAVVTYGFNTRACVTASSVADGVMQVCVQRSLPKINGGYIERQEFHVPLADGEEPEAVLAGAAAALVCGVEPNALGMK
jgi:hypothetical protein